jgi:hypothetical protein
LLFETIGTARLSSNEQNLPLTFFFPLRREYIQQEDLTKAARKVGEAKKHESKHARPPTATSFLIFSNSQTRCYSIAIDPLFSFSLHLIVSLHYAVMINYMISPRENTSTTLTHIQTHNLLPLLKNEMKNETIIMKEE